jgi:hypothetical protein
MPVPKDENDEHCYFMRPIFGCKDNDSSSDDVDGISDGDFEARPIFGCKDNNSLSEDSDDISDCNSEAIGSNSDGTERSSSIASSTGAVLVSGNGNSTRSGGSDAVDKLDKDNLHNESSLLIANSVQLDTMSHHCTNCRWHRVASGFHNTMQCVLSLLTYSSTSMRTRVAWSCIHSDNLQGLDQIVLCCECASFLVHWEPQSKRNVWPAFIWKMLANIHLFAVQGLNLWFFVPDQWRPWWILAMMEMTGLMGSYRCVTLMTPHSKFRDVMFARNVIKDSIQEL